MRRRKFVDREREIAFLEETYRRSGSQLIVIYGRRRIGKTELILKFLEGKPHIYFLADEEPEETQIARFARQAADALNQPLLALARYRDWGSLLEAVAVSASKLKEKLVIAIDEMPYLISVNKAFPSILQRAWDLHLSKANVMMILVGSSVAMMETEVLSYKSPLYGRRTGQWRVDHLSLTSLPQFLPSYSKQDLARVWGAAGGVPQYLKFFDDSVSFWENLQKLYFSKGGPLYEEAEFLLREELREPRNYKAIIAAIASGCTKLGEICSHTGLDRGLVSKYLQTLERLSIVQKLIPLLSSPTTRRSMYRVADPYFNFWFRYVQPNKTLIETGQVEELLKEVKQDYPTYMGTIYEDIVRRALPRLLKTRRVGKQWGRNYEIDVAATLPGGKILLLEVKWSKLTLKEAKRELLKLKAKAAQVGLSRPTVLGIAATKIQEKQELRKRGYAALDLNDIFSARV